MIADLSLRADGRRPSHWPVVFLMGPTAAGKTRLAMELAERLPLGVISVDSAMVYRGMDIGTGKPDRQALTRVPHALVDIRDPDETYSAAEFRHDALAAIAAAREAGRLPFLVGGTGLYFRALREGLSRLPPADAALRARLSSEAATHGWEYLHARLRDADPESARRIRSTDPQRIQRALEVLEITGVPMSRLLAHEARAGMTEPVCAFILEPADRARLHADIARRFDAMLRAGLVDEVRGLRARWPDSEARPSMRAVGYRQIEEYLRGRGTYPEMVERGVAATRQLARRQLTWLRAESSLLRLDCYAAGLADTVLRTLEARLAGGKKAGLDAV